MSAVSRTAERVSPEASDNFVYQRSRLAYKLAAERVAGVVLEIGTGTGYGVEILAPRVARLITLDKSAAFHGQVPANTEVRCATVPPLPLEDESVDAVVSFQVIEHVRRDRKLVEEVARVLRPGGVFIVSTPNRSRSLTRNPWHVREYTADQLAELLAGSFTQIEVLGVVGKESVEAYYEQNKASVARFRRWDVLDLEHRLPRWMLRLPYNLLNRLNRRRLLADNDTLTRSIRMEDYRLSPNTGQAFDLFAIARK